MKKLIFLLIFSFASLAVETIKVGLFNVPPFSYTDESGNLRGVTYLFLEKLAKESGLKFEYKLMPYQRVVSYLSDGAIDLAMLYPSDSFKKSFYALSESIGNDNLVITEELSNAKSLKDLGSKKIAVLRGAKYSKDFEENSKIEKIYVNNYTQAVSMFLSNRVGSIIIPKVALSFFLINHKDISPSKLKVSFILNHQHNWLHVRNNFPETLKKKIKEANERVIKLNNLKELDDLSLSIFNYDHKVGLSN